MYIKIMTAEIHNCRSSQDYEMRQALAIAKLQAHNIPVAISLVKKPVKARINGCRLVADCKCRNVCLVSDPSWSGAPVARCFACGNVYRVILPKKLEEIQALLMLRPLPHKRNWRPYQSVKDLQRENTKHRVRGEG